ncbi:phenylalanine tRNA beta subunit [Babesia ovata]|uniref:Phenylalanine tRNA beta subunit n=1 Tax=Babesia ovata TaxID=189622 RepID=A0A2H6K6F1_9APIC|nr:phenylalanine tRNA beta subunit [Babesia ovata]GBE58561.1 phenylalanine tRNA beta subunit [Babesia ovata]
MPTVSVPKDEFLRRLGGSLTLPELEELCFSFGVEYEECLLDDNGIEVIKIEIPANSRSSLVRTSSRHACAA